MMVEDKKTVKKTNVDIKGLFSLLQELAKIAFSGGLHIKIDENQSWIFFLRLGRLGWSTGGNNSGERWQRHLKLYSPKYLKLFCPNLKYPELDSITSAPTLEDQFSILFQILDQGLIEREQLAQLMTSVATEILFDVIQISQIKGASLSCELVADDPNGRFSSLLPLGEISPVLKQAVQNWQQWQSQGLANCSPNLFPAIEKSQHLENPSFSEAQKSILALVDGLHNLRGIAAITNVEMIKSSKFLFSLVKPGVISFSPVPVAKKIQFADSGKDIPVVTSSAKDILIACVDDSPTVCQGLEKIVQRQGYRFLGVQDSAKAVPLLLKNKPDFLFLDLVMPIANGYEICAQLRKMSSFKDLPIVILTGKDGLVDRMRAKMVGSTDFLSKPVQVGDVVKIIDKYLTSVQSS